MHHTFDLALSYSRKETIFCCRNPAQGQLDVYRERATAIETHRYIYSVVLTERKSDGGGAIETENESETEMVTDVQLTNCVMSLQQDIYAGFAFE